MLVQCDTQLCRWDQKLVVPHGLQLEIDFGGVKLQHFTVEFLPSQNLTHVRNFKRLGFATCFAIMIYFVIAASA
jgi:hypothetical protein